MLSVNNALGIYIFTVVLGLTSADNYKIPNVKLVILPQGFRVSIPVTEPQVSTASQIYPLVVEKLSNVSNPGNEKIIEMRNSLRSKTVAEAEDLNITNESGVKYVAFNINRNRSFKGFEPGEFSMQISTPKNNRWVYENTQKSLQKDDIIYIWTNVQHNQLIYRSIEDPISVDRLQVSNNIDSGNKVSIYDQTSTESSAPETNVDRNYSIDIRKEGGSDCEVSITQVRNRRVCEGELLFEDDFENGLDSNRWQYEVRVALDIGDAEFVLYDSDNESIKVSNGMLTIVPTLWNDDRPGTVVKQGILNLGSRCTSRQNLPQECRRQPEGLAYDILPPIKSARINTRNLFGFKFGRVDIRARVPHGDWLFPLILLEPTKNVFGPVVHELAQIRIAFARGNNNMEDKNGVRVDGRTLYAGTVLYSESSSREDFFVNVRRNSHFANEFHLYTLIWTNNKLSFQVDAQEYGVVDGRLLRNDSIYLQQFDQEFYITLGVAAGGHGDFPDASISNNRRKPWVNTSPKAAFDFWRDRSHWKTTWTKPEMEIDFVRVYAI